MKYYFLFFIIWLYAGLSSSRAYNIRQSNQRMEKFVNAQGFYQNTVNAITSDKNGYLWVATPNGLIRYDGYSFEYHYNDNGDQGSAQVPFDSDDIVYRNTDLRDRLGIPASMIRQLGVAPGEVVTVFPFNDNNTNMLVISPGDKAFALDDAIVYTVARDGEIRISNTMICNIRIGHTSKFAIEYDTKTNEIVVSPC